MVIDIVRTSLHKVLTTKVGEGLLPVRLPRDLARRVNVVFGEPICSRAEIDRRRSARKRLEELRRAPVSTKSEAKPVMAPVVVYFEKDRNTRLVVRIKEALDAKSIAFTELDVSGDPASKNYVMREAKCKEDDLPIVFIAGTAVGGYNDLVEWDVSGKLEKAVRGEDVSKSD
jgi:glutaredoxin